MKANDFLKLVGRMLTAQQNYFTSRLQGDLVQAKALEREVSAVIKQGRLEPDEPTPTTSQPGLFETPVCRHGIEHVVFNQIMKTVYCQKCKEEKEQR